MVGKTRRGKLHFRDCRTYPRRQRADGIREGGRMMSHCPSSYDLDIGRRKTGVSIHRDPAWPAMWRVHQGEHVSDMVNISRAKDAAIGWARPRGLGRSE